MPGTRLSHIALALALLAGVSYLGVLDLPADDKVSVLWKGAGVWLLAVYAALNARNTDGWLITGVLAMGALGDVLIERSLEQGAAAFLVGHVIAIALYLRNRRAELAPSQKWLAIVVIPAVVLISWMLTRQPLVAFYSLFLAAMAAAAWISRFPRYRVGVGAMMFVASDLLIFARMDALAGQAWANYAVWGLYFAGQALIAWGVVNTLRQDGNLGLSPEGEGGQKS